MTKTLKKKEKKKLWKQQILSQKWTIPVCISGHFFAVGSGTAFSGILGIVDNLEGNISKIYC